MTVNLIATINGLWTPGAIDALTPTTFASAQMAARDATRTLLSLTDPVVDFYLLARPASGGVQRSRWKLTALAGGPSMRLNTTQPHDSQVSLTLRVEPHADLQQVIYGEEADTMPHRGVLTGLVPALLLRARWGPSEREIVVGEFGTGVFMPLELAFSEPFTNETVKVDYEAAGLASYRFVAPSVVAPGPAMWLAVEGGGWQVSYCVASSASVVAQRWDDPAQDVPQYEPLPEPTWQ